MVVGRFVNIQFLYELPKNLGSQPLPMCASHYNHRSLCARSVWDLCFVEETFGSNSAAYDRWRFERVFYGYQITSGVRVCTSLCRGDGLLAYCLRSTEKNNGYDIFTSNQRISVSINKHIMPACSLMCVVCFRLIPLSVSFTNTSSNHNSIMIHTTYTGFEAMFIILSNRENNEVCKKKKAHLTFNY